MLGLLTRPVASPRVCLVVTLGLLTPAACGPKVETFGSVKARLHARTELVLLPVRSEFPSTRVEIDQDLRKIVQQAGLMVVSPAPSDIQAWQAVRFDDRYRAACAVVREERGAIVAAPTLSIGRTSRRECHLAEEKSLWNLLPDLTPDREQGMGTIWTKKRKCEGRNRAHSVLEVLVFSGPSCEVVARLGTVKRFEDDIPAQAERKAMARPISRKDTVELFSRVVKH